MGFRKFPEPIHNTPKNDEVGTTSTKAVRTANKVPTKLSPEMLANLDRLAKGGAGPRPPAKKSELEKKKLKQTKSGKSLYGDKEGDSPQDATKKGAFKRSQQAPNDVPTGTVTAQHKSDLENVLQSKKELVADSVSKDVPSTTHKTMTILDPSGNEVSVNVIVSKDGETFLNVHNEGGDTTTHVADLVASTVDPQSDTNISIPQQRATAVPKPEGSANDAVPKIENDKEMSAQNNNEANGKEVLSVTSDYNDDPPGASSDTPVTPEDPPTSTDAIKNSKKKKIVTKRHKHKSKSIMLPSETRSPCNIVEPVPQKLQSAALPKANKIEEFPKSLPVKQIQSLLKICAIDIFKRVLTRPSIQRKEIHDILKSKFPIETQTTSKAGSTRNSSLSHNNDTTTGLVDDSDRVISSMVVLTEPQDHIPYSIEYVNTTKSEQGTTTAAVRTITAQDRQTSFPFEGDLIVDQRAPNTTTITAEATNHPRQERQRLLQTVEMQSQGVTCRLHTDHNTPRAFRERNMLDPPAKVDVGRYVRLRNRQDAMLPPPSPHNEEKACINALEKLKLLQTHNSNYEVVVPLIKHLRKRQETITPQNSNYDVEKYSHFRKRQETIPPLPSPEIEEKACLNALEQLKLLQTQNSNYEVIVPLIKYLLGKNEHVRAKMHNKMDPPSQRKQLQGRLDPQEGRFDPQGTRFPTTGGSTIHCAASQTSSFLPTDEKATRMGQHNDEKRMNIFEEIENNLYYQYEGPKAQKEAKVVQELLGEAAKGVISWCELEKPFVKYLRNSHQEMERDEEYLY